MTLYTATAGYGAASTPGSAANDAFLGSGMTGGGGGGGGATTCYYTQYGYLEGGAGGAGAGGCTFFCNGNFNLTASGLIDGRGGNGGAASAHCGAGGGGAGGNLRIAALATAKLDGVVDLRGGRGGAHGFGQIEYTCSANVNTEKTARYGGDGSPGRLVVLAPNFTTADDVRVFGQLMTKLITTLPTTAVASVTPPNSVFTGSAITTTYSFPAGTTDVRWTSLSIASGAVVDLIYNTSITSSPTPIRIFVDGAVDIQGTLRLNGDSTSPVSNAGTLVQNRLGLPTYPYGTTYSQGTGNMYSTGSSFGGATISTPGMGGNLGGGKGGDGTNINTTGVASLAGGFGSGPAPGRNNVSTTPGYSYQGYWTMYTGDSGGSGGANATDGEDGWAPFAVPYQYAYLGATTDSAGTGVVNQSGASSPNFPKRLGTATTDPTLLTTPATNLASFVGSGGGGGNSGGDTYYQWFAYAGLGGGGGGAIGIISPISVSVSGTIEARGGDGQVPGFASIWSSDYSHGGGGGGSGGTVYIASDVVNIGAVSTSGTGGATFDLRGGMGGGYRSQNPSLTLQAYPEYMTLGSFGGNGGYGRLAIEYKTSLNSGRTLANRYGMEQTTIDSSSNTYKALAATARYYCPGLVAGGNVGRSKWYDLRSISPILTSASMQTVLNATLTLRVEGAQSLPNNVGGAAGLYGPNYAANTGAPDVGNTSGLFTPGASPILQGWRFLRFDATFTRTTGSTGGAVLIDNFNVTYTSDL